MKKGKPTKYRRLNAIFNRENIGLEIEEEEIVSGTEVVTEMMRLFGIVREEKR